MLFHAHSGALRLLAVALALWTSGLAQTLIIAPNGTPTGLDAVDSRSGFYIGNQITETLVGFEPGTTNPIPRLATTWVSNEDATAWTFSLREGVYFHDGTPFNAESVKFNYDRWNVIDHPHAFRDRGRTYTPWTFIFGGTRGNGSLLDAVEVMGEHEVVFRLTNPTPNFPLLTGVIYFQISSPNAIMLAGADYGNPAVGAVGTGPFIFERWIDGESIILTANRGYWDGAPQLDRVVYQFIPDATARLVALQAGTIDVAATVPSQELPTIRGNPSLVPIFEEELNAGWLSLNRAFPPLDNPLVRRAIAHAVDRPALVEAFFGEAGVLADGFVHPQASMGVEPWPYDYDPELAAALLRDAGCPEGFDVTFWYRPTSSGTNPSPRATAEAIASYLADVGIRVRLDTVDSSAYNNLRRAGEFAMFQGGWVADFADPDNFLSTIFGSIARTEIGWDDPQVRSALERARASSDREERMALYSYVDEVVREEVAAIPLVHSSVLHAHRSNIENWVSSPLGFWWVPLKDVVKR